MSLNSHSRHWDLYDTNFYHEVSKKLLKKSISLKDPLSLHFYWVWFHFEGHESKQKLGYCNDYALKYPKCPLVNLKRIQIVP